MAWSSYKEHVVWRSVWWICTSKPTLLNCAILRREIQRVRAAQVPRRSSVAVLVKHPNPAVESDGRDELYSVMKTFATEVDKVAAFESLRIPVKGSKRKQQFAAGVWPTVIAPQSDAHLLAADSNLSAPTGQPLASDSKAQARTLDVEDRSAAAVLRVYGLGDAAAVQNDSNLERVLLTRGRRLPAEEFMWCIRLALQSVAQTRQRVLLENVSTVALTMLRRCGGGSKQ